MATERMVVALVMIDLETGDGVYRVGLAAPLPESGRALERKLMGMLRNIDRDRYIVAEVYETE